MSPDRPRWRIAECRDICVQEPTGPAVGARGPGTAGGRADSRMIDFGGMPFEFVVKKAE